MVKQFDIFEDGVGVVRAKGRLQNANVPFETKAPIVLNKDHRLAYTFFFNKQPANKQPRAQMFRI